MKSISDYFDEAKAITGSDRQTAIQMGIAPNRISMARKDGCMSNEFCAALAAVLGISPLEIIAAAEVKKHPSKAEFWGRWVASVAIVATGFIAVFFDNSTGYEVFSFAPLYIMRSLGSVTCVLALLWIVSNIAPRAGHNMDVKGYA